MTVESMANLYLNNKMPHSLFSLFFRRHEDLSKTHANFAHSMIDKNQETSTRLVRDRTHEIYCMRTSLDRMIKSIADEIDSLAEQRRRLLVAMVELKLPESIGSHKSE